MHNYRNNVLNSIVRMYDLSPIVTLSSAERRSQDDSNVVDGDRSFPPVTCVVADGLLTWAIDAAEELGVLALAFRTSSACSFPAYQTVPELLELGELPFPEGDDLDEPVPAFRAWRASCVDRIFPACAAITGAPPAASISTPSCTCSPRPPRIAAGHGRSCSTRRPPWRGRRSRTSRRACATCSPSALSTPCRRRG